MKTLQELWEYLREYLTVDNALEQGFSNGKYTKELAKYAKHVVGIDVSQDFYDIANENLKDFDNIELKIMDATNMDFEDKSFDLILNTSFHEFDLSGDVYSLDLDLKRKILTEMIRVSNTIIFVEPTESAVTNELFKVFNPVENHADRIEKSNKLIEEFMQENGYELIKKGLVYDRTDFNTLEELEQEMLNWWSDIKIPTNEEEKSSMIKEIDTILEKAKMLKDLQVTEDICFRIFRKGA